MSIDRKNRIEEEYRKYISEYIERETNRDALISVTRIDLNEKMTEGIVFVSVLPESKEDSVIFFLTRNGSDIKKYLRKTVPHLRSPFFKFMIDYGEKNRLRIDQLSKE